LSEGLGAGQLGVCPGSDDGQHAPCGRQVVGREVAVQPGDGLIDGGADLAVQFLARIRELDGDRSPGWVCSSRAAVSSAIASRAAGSSIFKAPVIWSTSWSRSMAAPLTAVKLSATHWW
jgi:hypothetical protein